MYEVRIHGRGGQGAVTAANMLAIAAFKEGKDVQAFPIFGVERRGAPVAAFLRIDDKPIDIKSPIHEPDAVVVLDPTLLQTVDVTQGLKKGGHIIINTSKDSSAFALDGYLVHTVDATSIALENGLGGKTNPIVNTAILGAYSKTVGNIEMESIISAVLENSPSKAESNAEAVRRSHSTVKEARR
ncbi:MAG: 2-oxoacid:acceptor oxidoreductase family protein [Nanoarchaeota archaeon]